MKEKSSRRVAIVDPADWPDFMNVHVNAKLLQACTLRHAPVAREALSRGADVNCRRSDFLTPLHIAAEHNDTDLIKLLCDQSGIDMESRTLRGATPLHLASFLGHKEAIEKLLENGAKVNCKDNLGGYPLHYAALQKDIGSANILLTNNAHVNVYDVFHESPLYTSVIRRPCFSMIKLLLSHGAMVSSAPHQGSLGLLLEAVLFQYNESDMNILNLLFQHGANVNTVDSIGLRTPAHIAAMTGNLKLLAYLIENGADLWRKNRAGRTPMEVAVAYKNFEIVQLIENSVLNKAETFRDEHPERSSTLRPFSL